MNTYKIIKEFCDEFKYELLESEQGYGFKGNVIGFNADDKNNSLNEFIEFVRYLCEKKYDVEHFMNIVEVYDNKEILFNIPDDELYQ